ncbi:MAG: glucosaminidase domain-containing protein [Bacteroidales bacterium]|nr:glucosaminidase domain-containing protein [Bacteroidales bacterium]
MKVKTFLFLMLSPFFVIGQNKSNSTQDYINTYTKIAIEQEKQYGIPACITLAQGILESGSGRSRLATEANNHFGIKCHNDWKGKKIYKDDDKKNECFRVYDNAEQSYIDHSLFLVGKKRYAELFQLKITDYKGWAKGLKQAGYATNPKYPQLLIDIIELYDLANITQTYQEQEAQEENKEIISQNKEKIPQSKEIKQQNKEKKKPFWKRWKENRKERKKEREKRKLEKELQKIIDQQDVNRLDFEVEF